jgi:hypothetical protein
MNENQKLKYAVRVVQWFSVSNGSLPDLPQGFEYKNDNIKWGRENF